MTTPFSTARDAVSGLLAVGTALAAGELVAAASGRESSPYFAVGSTLVDHMPADIREWAIETFGTSDKTALFVGMGAAIAVLAACVGPLERRRAPAGAVVIAVFALVGMAAALDRPSASAAFAWPSIVAGLVGVLVLRLLMASADPTPGIAPGSPLTRRFVLTAGAVAVAAVAAGALARTLLTDTSRTVADRARLLLPAAAHPAPPVPPGADLPELGGANTFVTGTGDFYRIDTALQVPALSTDTWRLRVHGMVEHEFTIGWDELLAMPMTERLITLTCVSNGIGGDLIGNARWLGVPMRELLKRAGVHPGADMLLSTSADGWTAGTPVAVIGDGRDALLAVGMNGGPLPLEHGYPVRQVIPGLYGYVSATKWVVDWELTTFDKATAYWTDRGWSAKGPIKLASRIDRPTKTEQDAGDIVLAGTAWMQHTGIAGVRIRIDDGPWQQAQLAADYSDDTWRLWHFTWRATPGRHRVECRAVGKNGEVQTEKKADPVPDGATGLHSRSYIVR